MNMSIGTTLNLRRIKDFTLLDLGMIEFMLRLYAYVNVRSLFADKLKTDLEFFVGKLLESNEDALTYA